MAASAIALGQRPNVVARPNPFALWAIAPAGCAVAAFSVLLALTDEAIGTELGEPLVIALLADWITLSYVLGGTVVWWSRPESRFGPLMIVAGFVTFFTTLHGLPTTLSSLWGRHSTSSPRWSSCTCSSRFRAAA
jgi:hypothetical protein